MMSPSAARADLFGLAEVLQALVHTLRLVGAPRTSTADRHHSIEAAGKHARQVRGVLLVLLLSDLGRIGETQTSKQTTKKTIIQPHFQQLYEAEVEEGKSGWAARRAKQRWLH
jgi:hypothetical protein